MFGLLLFFWPLGLFSSSLCHLGCQECMCPTSYTHVCYDGAAVGDGVWMPSQRIPHTLKLQQSADSGLLLYHPRLCSQSERVDRYHHCYLAADILRLDVALGRHRLPDSDSLGGKDWTSWLKNKWANRLTAISLLLWSFPLVIPTEEREIILYWIVNWPWVILGNILDILLILFVTKFVKFLHWFNNTGICTVRAIKGD